MKIDGHPYRTIWLKESEPTAVCVIDQRLLPHTLEIVELTTVGQMVEAIRNMTVRGAPLIGVAAAHGMYLAAIQSKDSKDFKAVVERRAQDLTGARPTAVNLSWAVGEQLHALSDCPTVDRAIAALRSGAEAIAEQDVEQCRKIGEFGLEIIRDIHARNGGRVVNVLTHCNAGWLCAVDWGTATAPIYQAFNQGLPVHVWVDETRPRNQGASLTAWELGHHGVPYTLITDNAGGHLMQNGMVDMVIVGTDRVARNGDVANKIGTYLKALAAHANSIPFYVAAPSSSIDWELASGKQIPIEERDADEVKFMTGMSDGQMRRVLIAPEGARVANFGFDVTPRHLVTGLITERGTVPPDEEWLCKLFPDKMKVARR